MSDALNDMGKDQVRIIWNRAVLTAEDQADLDLLPIKSLQAVARAMASGVNKHGLQGWRSHPPSWRLNYDATLRHLRKFWAGNDWDDESRELHLAHAAANILILIDMAQSSIGIDDRQKS